MLDRFKKPDSEPSQPEEARPAPLPGGFGRRQVPVGAAAIADMPAPPSGGFGRRQSPVGQAASPQSVLASAPQAASAQSASHAGDTETARPNAGPQAPRFDDASDPRDRTHGILTWLMARLDEDHGGFHPETAFTILGGLAGFTAQQACWDGLAASGKDHKKIFHTLRTESGETFYLSDFVNEMVAGRGDPPSIASIVGGAARKAGVSHFPNVKETFAHVAAVIGTDQFGVPRVPAGHQPRIRPREAVNLYWAKAQSLVAHEHPAMRHRWFALSAGTLLLKMQASFPADIAMHIVMEAAVPMSKIDPATVPQ